jgi:hypothetical protein
MNCTLTKPSFFFKYVAVLLILLCSGCASSQMEQTFFDKEYDQDGSRFATYSIPDQIKIYLYGVQIVRPPIPVLSRPIAERGQAAVPFILGELQANPTEQNIKDLMVIFETMQRLGTYDVQHDKALLRRLDAYVNGMTNKIWQGYTKEKLTQIKKSLRDEDGHN